MDTFEVLIDTYRSKLIDICQSNKLARLKIDQFRLSTDPPSKWSFDDNDYIFLTLIDYKDLLDIDEYEEYKLIDKLIRSEDYSNYIIVAELLKKYKIKEEYLK